MAHDMYLTYEEYLALGGAIDAAAWPPLECACRKRIDRITDCRVQNMAEVPKAVKLCIFALAQMESAVGPWHRLYRPRLHRSVRMATLKTTGMCRTPRRQPSR